MMSKQEILETLEKQLQLLSERSIGSIGSIGSTGFGYDVLSNHSKVMLEIASVLLNELE